MITIWADRPGRCVLGSGEKSTNSDMSTDGGITTGCDPGMWIKPAGMPAAKTQIYSQGETNTFMWIKTNTFTGRGKNKYIHKE